MLPKWLVAGLGALLIAFVALLVVQKAHDLQVTFANQKPANTISVSGEGKVTASPDLATVNIGVLSQGSDAKAVKDLNNGKINKIIDFIKAQGVDAKDIQTSQFYSYPQYDYRNGTNNITGYQANQTITVKVHGVDKDQKKLETVLDGAVNNGANEIQGVGFSFENPDDLKQQARKMAIQQAKEKAQELAQEAGLKLGKVVSVSESGGYYPGPIPYAMDAAKGLGMGGGGTSVAPNVEPGSQDITQTMTVVFELK